MEDEHLEEGQRIEDHPPEVAKKKIVGDIRRSRGTMIFVTTEGGKTRVKIIEEYPA